LGLIRCQLGHRVAMEETAAAKLGREMEEKLFAS